MKGFVVIVIAFLTLEIGRSIAALPKQASIDENIEKSKSKSENDKSKKITSGKIGINKNVKKSTGFGMNKLDGYGSSRFNEDESDIRDVALADMLGFEGFLAKIRAKRGGVGPLSIPFSTVPLTSTATPATTNSTSMTSSSAVTTTNSGMNSSLLSSGSVSTTQGSTGNQNTGGSAKQSGKDCTCRNESCNLTPALTVLFLTVTGSVLFS